MNKNAAFVFFLANGKQANPRRWNIHNVSSCTGNHALHAVGVARAIKQYKVPGVAICSQGESSVSEGYVYEAINGASKEQLPVIFVFA